MHNFHHDCCDEPKQRIVHRMQYHACCWIWKIALVPFAIHIILHLFGIPHPEVLSFIP